MKRLTMCTLILTLASIVPIADTQLNNIKTFAIDLYYDSEKEQEKQKILHYITNNTGVNLQNNNKVPIISNDIESKWDRAITILYYPICEDANIHIFIASRHLRLDNQLLIPEMRDMKTPVTPLFPTNTHLVIWEKNEIKGLANASNELVKVASEYFLDAYEQ